MAKQDFIPNAEPDFLTWHDNYKTQVAALKTTFGLTDAEVTAVADDNTDAHAKIAALTTANAAQQTATQTKKASRKTTEVE